MLDETRTLGCSHETRRMSDFYYTLRFFIWGIFAYLQETVAYEFPRLFPVSKPVVEPLESKRNRINLSTKYVAAELTFFVICAFLVVLIILSFKYPKDDEDEYEKDKDEEVEKIALASKYKTTMTTSGNPVCPIPHQCTQPKDDKFSRHDCGDSSFIPQIQEDFATNNYAHSARCSRSPLGLVRETPAYFSERQQVKRKVYPPKPICRRMTKQQHYVKIADREWFVRRTRSGQIYGKYPF